MCRYEKMLYGIVDIGSNTVRLNVYEMNDSNAKFLFSKKYALGLASYITKRKLNKTGQERLMNVVEDIKEDLTYLNVENFNFFATASIRNVKNSEEVVNKIYDELEIPVDVLSEDDEAKYSFLGSVSIMNKNNGVLIDVGGGSTEIVIYQDKKIKESYSLPLGSLTLYNSYVSSLVPNTEECLIIEQRIQFELEKAKIKPQYIKYMCGVGGSVRAVLKLMKDLKFVERGERIINPKTLSILRRELCNNDKQTYDKLIASKPARIHTLIPGLIIIQQICKFFNIEEIQVSKYGVREGYLNAKLGM